MLRLTGGAPVPIHELWHVVLPCYSCFGMHGSLTFIICQSDECQTSLIDRLCYSIKILSIPRFNVLGAVRDAGCRNRCIWSSQHWQHERTQNISGFVSLVLHLAVGAHSILELRCRFHIGEREPFASSISSKLWSCGLRHAQVTHHNLLHIWGTKWCLSLCHVFRYFDHLLLCNVKVTIHCICGDQPFWMS